MHNRTETESSCCHVLVTDDRASNDSNAGDSDTTRGLSCVLVSHQEKGKFFQAIAYSLSLSFETESMAAPWRL